MTDALPPAQVLADAIYDRVLSDPELMPFFVGHTLESIRSKFGVTLYYLMRADRPPYTEVELRRHHQSAIDKGLTAAHVARFVRHVRDALNEKGVAGPTVETACRALEGVGRRMVKG